jgi:hypothetical protein
MFSTCMCECKQLPYLEFTNIGTTVLFMFGWPRILNYIYIINQHDALFFHFIALPRLYKFWARL